MNIKLITCPGCNNVIEATKNLDEITCCICDTEIYEDIECYISPTTLESSYLTKEDITSIDKFIERQNEIEEEIKKEDLIF